MATPYDNFNTYGTPGPGGYAMGTGAITPYLLGEAGTPASAAAATAAIDAAGSGGATGPWGTDSNLNLNLGGGVKGLPITTGSNGWGGRKNDSGFGFNLGTLDVVLGGVKTVAGIWDTWERNKIAKQQLAMQRNLANANLGNQTLAYNAAYKDRITNRIESGGWTPQRGADYLKQYSLPTRTV